MFETVALIKLAAKNARYDIRKVKERVDKALGWLRWIKPVLVAIIPRLKLPDLEFLKLFEDVDLVREDIREGKYKFFCVFLSNII